MDPHLNEWLNLGVRWLHVIAGIAWIGASFYFNWLENNINRTKNLRAGIAGDLWAIHGGGFYFLEKYQIAPEQIPETLHWFKWEAYWTWISGFALLVIVYYFNAEALLVDKSIADLSTQNAILISLGTIFGSWFIYDGLCKSRLSKIPKFMPIVGFILLCVLCYGMSRLFSPRAAYIHVGAVLGTLMAANVFRVIIPSQSALVEAAKAGKNPDATLGKNAGRRSLHNNYMTLPVVLIMISNHFPSTYGNQHGWIILVGLSLLGAGIRHYFNVRKNQPLGVLIWPLAFCGFVLLAFMTRPAGIEVSSEHAEDTSPGTFQEVQTVIATRCQTCHSAHPTDDVFTVAPIGVMFDTPDQIKKFASRIYFRAVNLKTMPLANKTGMTDDERKLLGRWYAAGAKIE